MNKKMGIYLISIFAAGAMVLLLHHQSIDQKRPMPITQQTMARFLADYITINTAHPNPDYAKAISFLKQRAQADGFTTQEIVLPSGNRVLVTSLAGSRPELPALALNHHMDVVPAGNIHNWDHDPFGGVIKHDTIFGRGSQDMKGVGVVHYFALKQLKETGIQPDRSIHLLAVPDEEIGGFNGAQQLVATDQFKRLNIGYIVDEGIASGSNNELLIKVTERKPIQIRITSQGTEGHGSKIMLDNAIHKLCPILHRISTFQQQQKKQCCYCATSDHGLSLSMHVTSLQAGVVTNGVTSLNMVPQSAAATVDIRVPYHMKLQEAHTLIQKIIGQSNDVAYQVLATVPEQEQLVEVQTALYTTIAQAIEAQGLRPKLLHFEATTDLRHYIGTGIQGIGLTPFTCKDNLHGINESITMHDLVIGKNLFFDFLKLFCYDSM